MASKKQDFDFEKMRLDYAFEQGIDFRNRVIRVTGPIGTPGPFDISFTTFDMVDAAMTEMEKQSNDPVTIRINSPGGEVYEGLAIVGRLSASPCQIITESYGHTMSAATLITACGDIRKMSKYTIAMFHQCSYGLQGSHEEVKQEVEQMEREEKLWAKWMANLSKKSEKFWFTAVKKKNVYLTAEEMLKYGVIDEII
jgi:ATP-dependent Clp protease protease subunit